MSESCKQALLLIAITVCLVLVLNPNALSSIQAFGQRRAELPRRVLSQAEMQQFTTTANTGEIVMVGANGVLIDQGTQAVRVGTSDVSLIAGGAERVRVLNDGKVGIGVTNPSTALQVNGHVNLNGALQTVDSDLGYTAASFAVAALPTGVQGGTLSGTYRLTALSSQASMAMNISGFTFLPGVTYKYTFTGLVGSVALSLTVLQNTSTTTVSNTPVTNNVTTTAQTITGFFTTANTGGNLAFNFQAASANPFVNWTGFSLTRVDTKASTNILVDGNVGIGVTNPVFKTSIFYAGANDSSTTAKYNFGLEISNTVISGSNNRSNLILFTDANSTHGAIGGYRNSFNGNFMSGLQFLVGGQPTGYQPGRPVSTSEASSSLIEAMRIDPYGNVGIGLTIPEAKLHVAEAVIAGDVSRREVFRASRQGTGAVQNSVSMAFSLGADRTSINPYGSIDIKVNGFPNASNNYGLTPDVTVMSILGSGNVGIGVTNTVSKLDVYQPLENTLVTTTSGYFSLSGTTYGYVPIHRMHAYRSGINPASGEIGMQPLYNGSWVEGPVGSMQFRVNSVASTGNNWGSTPNILVMTLTGQGYVGIGTNNPQAPLHVEGTSSGGINTTQYSYFNVGSASGFFTGTVGTFYPTIWAQTGIAAGDYIAAVRFSSWSDIRIKKNIQPKSGLLSLVNQINLYSYEHIDESKGKVEVGVIAQEVREVLPHLVNNTEDFLPNIYKEASDHSSSGDIVRIYIENKTSEEEELKLIVLVNDNEKSQIVKILNCSSEWIEVKKWEKYSESQRVFVYGTKDKEVLSVDKVQLGIVALGAVKELSKKNQQLEQQVSDLIYDNQQLNTRLSRLESLLSR